MLLALLFGARGAEFEPVVARSTSGQFVVRGLPQAPLRSGQSTSEVGYLRLDPSLTAVSLERIRQSLYGELNLPDKWRGLVTVNTFPAQEDGPPITVTSIHYADGWGYRVEIPEIVEKPRFVRCAVNVILREFANRNALTREAELPPWLAEGLASELEATSLPSLALEPTLTPGLVRLERGHDPLRHAREVVRAGGLLTFTQLSLPTETELSGANRQRFQACSHLFVRELLRLRGGREALRDMLERLPQHLNWQTAFLRAFESRFPRLIEVDKWYTLTTTHVSGRDNTSAWPTDTTLSRLDEILSTTVQVRTEANDLPLSAPVSLQRVLGEWEPSKQTPVLELKRLQLEMLLGRAAPEVADSLETTSRPSTPACAEAAPRPAAGMSRAARALPLPTFSGASIFWTGAARPFAQGFRRDRRSRKGRPELPRKIGAVNRPTGSAGILPAGSAAPPGWRRSQSPVAASGSSHFGSPSKVVYKSPADRCLVDDEYAKI